MPTTHLSLITVSILAFLAPATRAADIVPLLRTLQAVGPDGVGHRPATRAWTKLMEADAAQLPTMLVALDGVNPIAANWIGSAVDAVAQRQLQQGRKLPTAELEQFLQDRRHHPRARRLAYEWLLKVDPAAGPRLVPTMLDDPSLELRRDAVSQLAEEAESLVQAENRDGAVATLQKALSGARDPDQIGQLTDRLRKLGETVDLPRHFGFLTRWKLIGPFDNTDQKGVDTAYPPERQIDLSAAYPGKHGEVRWVDYASQDDYGAVDLNQALGKEKSVVGYATTQFLCNQEQEVDFRLSSYNGARLWLNGELIHAHDIYHTGMPIDQYVSRARLRSGRNEILVKVCQNAQQQEWAGNWVFQLRVCDANGTAILSLDRAQ